MTTLVVSRKVAFKIAWAIFSMATGSGRIGIRVTEKEIVLLGSSLLEVEGL